MPDHRFRSLDLLAVSALLILFVGLASARAATINVDCSAQHLRDAVAAANSGDIFELTAGCTYTFTAGESANPDTAMFVDTVTITINGNGAIIERDPDPATDHFRLIYIINGGGLTLNDVTLRNAYIDNDGGALINNGGTLIVNNSTITNNFAGNEGGALFNYNGATAAFNNTILSNNTATDDGGAIHNGEAGVVTLTDSHVTGNKTLGNDGGAVSNFDLDSTIRTIRTTFTDNTTPANGGAIANEFQRGTVEVTDSTFSGNSASNYAGAIYNGTLGVLTITGSTFTSNTAGSQGGAIAFGSTIAGTISTSTFTHNIAYYGGAIALSGAGVTLNVSDSTFDGATQGIVASYGGGIWNYSGSTLNVSGSTFVGLHVDEIGGAIQNDGFDNKPTQTNVVNSTFYGNAAINGAHGGAISNANNATLTVTNSTISANLSYDGGGIVNFTGAVSLGSSIISANTDLGNISPNLSGAFSSLGHNVIDDTSGATISGDTGSNLTGVAASPLNLGVPDDNGGLTQTMALGEGSVAIGHGDCTGIPTDQRSANRKTPCDVGAYETAANVPPPAQNSGNGSSSAQSGGAETTQCVGSGSGSVPGGMIYCRIIARNGQFLASPAEIGIQSIIDMGVVQAINIIGMLPNGVAVTQFAAPVGLCLSGSGDVVFVSAGDPNRTIQRLPTSTLGAQKCVTISSPGLVMMVNQSSGLAAPPPAPASGTPLANYQVRTANAPINLRAEPNTSATILNKLPDNLTLTATAFVPGWYKVIYLDSQGWVSDQFLKTLGACGD